MEPFSFEHTFEFDEELYVQLNSLFKKKNKPLRLTLVAIAGVACLFWPFSLLLGITILILVIVSLFAPKLVPQTVANNFYKIKYLNQKLTYGVSEEKLWVIGEQINIELGWKYAVVWEEREGWLRISPDSSPALWFEVEKLKEAGVYEKILKLCHEHAVRFNS